MEEEDNFLYGQIWVDKAKDLVSELQEKVPNEYDYNLILKFAEDYYGQTVSKIMYRQEALRIARDLSAEGTSAKAVLKNAEEFYNFLNV
jgi:hypothetical protein